MKSKLIGFYVQDGLIGLFDAENNSGYGVHNASATTWKNLVGDFDATSLGSNVWGDNYVSRGLGFKLKLAIFSGMTQWTVEGAWETSSAVNGYANIFGKNGGTNYGGTNSGLGRWDTSALIYGSVGGLNLTWDNTGYGARTSALKLSPSKTAYLAKNGTNIVSKTVSDSNISNFTGVTSWYLAAHNGTGKQNKFFCIRIYNRALTQAECQSNYNIDRLRFGY